MKDLIVSRNLVEFMGKHIPIVEGGFGEKCRVLSDLTISKIHNMENKNIRGRITSNINRFKEGVDYIDLKGAYDTSTLEMIGYSKQSISQANNIYVLSERGYGKLIKIMDSDLAWEIYDKLLDEYFTMREQIQTHKIPQTYAEALLEAGRLALENDTLKLQVKEQAPKVEFADKLLKSKANIKIGDFAKVLCSDGFNIGEIRLFNWLRANKYIYKENGNNKPYQTYVDRGYFVIKETPIDSAFKTFISITTLLTPEGQVYLYSKLKDIKEFQK